MKLINNIKLKETKTMQTNMNKINRNNDNNKKKLLKKNINNLLVLRF
jgi:hypothetical protein